MVRAVLFDLYGTLITGDVSAEVEAKDEGLSRVLREAGTYQKENPYAYYGLIIGVSDNMPKKKRYRQTRSTEF